MRRTLLLLGILALMTAPTWAQQVLLRVRFAQFDAVSEALLAPHLTATQNKEMRTLDPTLDLVTLLEDLRARGGSIRMLAEPALLTSNAQPARLMLGNSVAVPEVRDGAVSIHERDMGIELLLEPAIHPDGIRLSVKPSVSTLRPAAQTGQITIPAFGTRTSQTELTVASGQSVIIDGLLDEAAQTLLRTLPRNEILETILKNGAQPNTKLIVIVTPEVL